MKSNNIRKRSVVLNGHKTSISLEQEFFETMKEIATARGVTISAFVAGLDNNNRTTTNLSSAIRVACLLYVRGTAPVAAQAAA